MAAQSSIGFARCSSSQRPNSAKLSMFCVTFLNDFLTVKITHPDLMKLIGPIHSQIKAFQLLCLLGYRFSISGALNSMFALYRSSTKGQLSIEPQLRSLAGRDSLPLFLKSGLDESGPHASKLLEIGSTKLSYATSPC